MAIIKKFSPFQNLSSFNVFLNDTAPNSQYFKITEFRDTFTGGKNGFLIEGSEFLKESTEVKVEILDVENQPIYYEPGDGVPEYYEGISKLVSVHVYDDTPIGTGKITVLGELKNYVDENGAVVPVPDEWKGIYNVKWERTFQINKNLNNESIVRFYKRPIVNVTELVKPIFSKSIPTVTDSGFAHGISETPIDGTDIRNWRAGTLYRVRRTSGSWDRDVDEATITFTSPEFTSKITEVLNDTDVLVDVPYTIDNFVSNFTSGSYSVSYADFQNEVIGESTLTGSFAKIDITQLKTFVGDVARVKVFRKSRNSVGDFQFVQESKLESSELLRDITTTSNTEIPYGRFDETNLETYWVTSSDDHEVSIDSSVLSQAVKFDYDSVSGGVQRLITSQSLNISKDVEYTLNFRTLLSGSLDDTNKSVKAFFSSSDFTQDFVTVSGSAIYRTRQSVSQNIISENSGSAYLVFEVKGEDWYLSNVSLKNAQDTSFSPDEFTLIQDIPRKLASETFDFRFEFYDINNNYIPVDVTATGVFDGGNDFPTSGKLLTFESDRNAFRFSSGSLASPPFQQLQFKVTQNNLTGSVTFDSSAFDVDGVYIDPSSYSGDYPGLLTNVTPAGAILTVANFSGSDGSVVVGSIVYTASLDSLEEFETVYRLEDGDNAPTLLVTSNANQFTYEPTSLSPKPPNQSITVRAQRKNLASLVTPIEINSGSNTPALTYVDTVGGIDTYTLSSTDFSASFSANSFDEVTYSFTGSDIFGVEQSDEITISKVVNFDGVSVTLSNESTAFRSNGQGLVLDSFDTGDGVVEVRIADKEISHNNGLNSPNTFDIVSATATNVTEKDSSYTTNEYGVTAISADSGSLLLNISYLAGDNSTTQSFQKKVNYTKNRIAQPSIIIDTTNKTQNVDAKSTGVQLTPFEDSTITVREFYTGSVTTFSSSDVAISFDSNPSTIATDNGDLTFSYSNLGNSTNSTQVQFTATVTDSEGTSRSVSDSISLSKSLKSAPNVEVQAYPTAQSIQADSNGSGSNSPVDLSLVVSEGGTSRTITGIGTITKTGGLNVTTPSSPYTTISFSTDASDMTSDTGTLTIPVQTTNSEGTSIEKDVVVTVTRVKKSAPSVVVSANIPSQVVTANSAGTQTGTLSDVTVTALEGNTNVFDSMTVAGSSGFDSTPTISSNTLQLSSRTLSSDTGIVTLTVNYTDSEGLSTSQSLTINASKVEQPAGAVTIELDPPSQAVPIDIQDTITAPSTFDVQVYDSEGEFTYSATLGSNATFKITNVSQTNTGGTPSNSSGTITPSTPSNANGSDVTFDVTYKGRDGLTSDAISKTHSVRVISEGSTGPGIVFTGPWDTDRIYQYDVSDGRRDAVLYNGRYFATKQTTTTSTPEPTNGGDSYWEDLGTDSFFVAGEIAIFRNSYVQEVLNIGTTSNTLSAANITLNGSDAYPYFSLGQSATVGTQEFGANGIFIGRHDVTKNTNASNGAYVLSLVNGTTSHMKWDGSSLDIKGSITVTGGNAATQAYANTIGTNSVASGSASAAAAQTAAELFASTASSNAVVSGSNAASNAVVSGSNAASTAQSNAITQAQADASASINLLANGNWTAGSGTFITSNSISSPVIAGNAGYISTIFKVGQNGITLDGTNKKIYVGTGTYNNSNTAFYVDDSDNFSLGDKVTWDGATFTVTGDIVGSDITGTSINGGTVSGATLIGGSINVPNSTDPLFQVNSSGVMTATDANITGEITATSGLLGNWVVDPPSSGGSLKDDDGRIVLNPTDKRISLFNSSGELKAQINADDTLSGVGTGNIYISGIGNSTSAPAGATSNSGNTSNVEGTAQYSTAQTFNITATGDYQLNQLFDYSTPPTIDLSSKVSSLGIISTTTGNPSGNITPFYSGQQYSSWAYGKGITQTLYLVIEKTSDNSVIAEIQCSTANARGGYTISNYYYSTGTGIYDWQYQSGYSSSGNAWSSQTSSPISSVVNFTATGEYRVRYKSVMFASSGYRYYLDGTSNNGTYTYYVTSGIGGVSLSSLDTSVLIAKPSNFIEMSGGGFQAVTNSEQFVKINRYDASNSNWEETLLQVRGGKTLLQQPDPDDDVLTVSGIAKIEGRNILGQSWAGSAIRGHSQSQFYSAPEFRRYSIPSSGGSSSSPQYINPLQGAFFTLAPGSSTSQRYYALPHRQFGTSTSVPFAARERQYSTDVYDVEDIPDGTVVFIFNTNNGRDAYIEGLSGRGDDNGWYTLDAGNCVQLIFSKATLRNGSTTKNYEGGWILLGHDDGNINSW